MTVLIVDDEPYMTEYIKNLVDWESYGFDRVLIAGGSSLARDLAMEYHPELLITDIKMPRASGLDLVKMLSEENCQTKVIIMSGYSEFEYAREALRCGALEYLVKPVLKEDLAEVLTKMLKIHKESGAPMQGKERQGATDREGAVARVKEYVIENFDKDLSLEKLAKVAHFHPTYLSKVFKEVTDRNLLAYVTDIRMQKAAELLTQTDLQVNDVMRTVGYQKSQHFVRLFKEKYGMSPREYRQAVLRENMR